MCGRQTYTSLFITSSFSNGSDFWIATSGSSGTQGVIAYDSNGLGKWRYTRTQADQIVVDSDSNVYTFATSGDYVTVFKLDSNGNFVWGHQHAGCVITPTSGFGPSFSAIQMDPDGLHVVASGFLSGSGGEVDNRDDVNFRSAP